ncbi:MAG: hypothetical protein IPP32_11810 [Bacteroidetes bacterium]|nr:hypothetical protein [Bacteroidota bacterium]
MKSNVQKQTSIFRKLNFKNMQRASICIAVLLILGTISSCKKKDSDPEPELDAQTQQFNDDANKYKNESDEVSDNINAYIKDIPAFGRMAGPASTPICGVTVDSSQLAQKILFFNFDGVTSCLSPSRIRSGQIKVQLTSGVHWSDPGAVLTETFINYKVVRQSDNKSITINGVKKITNVNGNNWLGFILGTANLKYKERAFNVQVKFDNAQTATWNSAHVTEYSYAPASSKTTFSCLGDTSLNGYSNVSAWGVNRFSQTFTTNYNSAWVSNSYCGFWRPISGELVHHVNNSDFTLTLGVDQNGVPNNANCSYGYKVTWVSGNSNGSVVLSY